MTVRTFTCVHIDEGAREALRRWQEKLRPQFGRDLRWVDPENMHITLKFLGDVEEERLEGIGSALRRAVQGFSPFTLELASAGAFPSLRRPRVLWAGVGRGREELCGLQEAIEREMEQSEDFPPERRDYHPHVTVARIRGRGPGPSLKEAVAAAADRTWGKGRVGSVILMRSDLRPGGPVYTPVREVELFSPDGT